MRTFLAIVFLIAQAIQSPALQYVCPMHPDVRSATPGNCPRCAMALVPRSADVGNEVLELSATPKAPLAGKPVALTFVVTRRRHRPAAAQFRRPARAALSSCSWSATT